MGKTALVFPGQGAQYPGMGKELYESSEDIMWLYRRISDAVGFDVAEASFGSLTGRLGTTGVAQPCIFAHSMAGYMKFKELGGKADAAAGFSLGECTAICAAGALDLTDATRMIAARAGTMQKEAEAASGAMYAVMGADEARLSSLLNQVRGYVEMVNFNCPGQIVIAGDADACTEAAALCSENGLKAVRLNVNAAFHSSLMDKASVEFGAMLKGMRFKWPGMEVFSNVTGSSMSWSELPEVYFPTQMLSPVRWQGLVEGMIKAGYDRFIEIGPSKTLSGMIRRISKDVAVVSADKPSDFSQALSQQ